MGRCAVCPVRERRPPKTALIYVVKTKRGNKELNEMKTEETDEK